MLKSLIKIHWTARIGLALLFLYHGLVPKILWLNATELELVELHQLGVAAPTISLYSGIAEILFALVIVFTGKSLLSLQIAALILVALLVDVIFYMPALLIEIFNPVTTNLLGLTLCFIAISSQRTIARHRSY